MNFPALWVERGALAAPWLRAFDALFPPRCGGCGQFSQPIFCERCARRLRVIAEPCCARCGAAFDPLACGDAVCAVCRERPPAFERARACWKFEAPVRDAIHRFKYNGRFAMAPRLARLMVQTPAARVLLDEWHPHCLTPVALHASRTRARGFNQSALLARELGSWCALPALDLLRRTRATPPQVGLDRRARRHNVREAFEVKPEFWRDASLTGARILLIDDVFTTGATLHECARVLLEAGAGAVGALTIARR